jgi:hypothetical protein
MSTEQRQALAVVIDAAHKWRDELGEYIIPDYVGDDDERAAQYQAEHDSIDAALATLAKGCGATGPHGYRCTEHANGEHIARGTVAGSFAEAWPL